MLFTIYFFIWFFIREGRTFSFGLSRDIVFIKFRVDRSGEIGFFKIIEF